MNKQQMPEMPISPWQILASSVKTGDMSRAGQRQSNRAKRQATERITVEFADRDARWECAREYRVGMGMLINSAVEFYPDSPPVRRSLHYLSANIHVASEHYLVNPDDAPSDIGMDTEQAKRLIIGAYSLLGVAQTETRSYVIFDKFKHHMNTVQSTLVSGEPYAEPGLLGDVTQEFAHANTDLLSSLAHKPREAFRNKPAFGYYIENMVNSYLALVPPSTASIR